MENQIIQYFKGERYESLIFLAAGAAAIAAAAYFLLKQKTPFHFGLSTGIVAIGLIQIVVGYSVYSRTEAQVMELKNLYENDKSAYVALEEPLYGQGDEEFCHLSMGRNRTYSLRFTRHVHPIFLCLYERFSSRSVFAIFVNARIGLLRRKTG